MYYGYGQMWTFTFVPVGFVIALGTMICLGLVYAVGASRGRRAAAEFLRWTMYGFLALAAIDLVWATISGQLGGFLEAYSAAPLIEMITLALLGVGSLWFMGTSYVRSKND